MIRAFLLFTLTFLMAADQMPSFSDEEWQPLFNGKDLSWRFKIY